MRRCSGRKCVGSKSLLTVSVKVKARVSDVGFVCVVHGETRIISGGCMASTTTMTKPDLRLVVQSRVPRLESALDCVRRAVNHGYCDSNGDGRWSRAWTSRPLELHISSFLLDSSRNCILSSCLYRPVDFEADINLTKANSSTPIVDWSKR